MEDRLEVPIGSVCQIAGTLDTNKLFVLDGNPVSS